MFGTIYTNALTPDLTTGVAAAIQTGTADAAVIAAAAEPIVAAYADALRTVFLWTVPVALLGFVVSLFLKQVRL